MNSPEQLAAEVAEMRTQVDSLKNEVQILIEHLACLLASSVVAAGQFALLAQLIERHTGAKYKAVDLENHVRQFLLRLGDTLPIPAEALEKTLTEMGLLTPEKPAP